jgi:hypothetical protein
MTAFAARVLPEWRPPAAAAAVEPPPRLDWSGPARVRPLLDADPRGGYDLGSFSAALARCGLFDNRLVALPGATVVLPAGMRLVERFAALVHGAYRAAGLAEVEFPLVAPRSAYTPLAGVLRLDGRLLHCTTDGERGEAPRMTLGPSGEAVIYDAWRRQVRHAADLPIEIYRRARFFRPASPGRHSGRGILRPLESGDVFELHCAYATEPEQQAALERFFAMFAGLAEACHVPILWSVRPPWSNQWEIARWALAGDVPLPIGATVQAASLYDQGQILSRAYGIGVRRRGAFEPTFQLAGALTRRLLLCHLMLGSTGDGFVMHPDLAADQVGLTVQARAAGDPAALDALAAELRAGGLRVAAAVAPTPAAVRKRQRELAAHAVPVQALLQGRRGDGDRWRAVVTRADTGQELGTTLEEPRQLAPLLHAAVREVGAAWTARARRWFAGRWQEADRASLRDILRARLVAVCPLAPAETVVSEVGSWGLGEVLGYARAAGEQPCVLSGALTSTVGIMSPRV